MVINCVLPTMKDKPLIYDDGGEWQVFASRPDQPHSRISSPKGMCLYRVVISVPPPSGGILGLPPEDSRFIERAFAWVAGTHIVYWVARILV